MKEKRDPLDKASDEGWSNCSDRGVVEVYRMKKLLKNMTFQVLSAIFAGILLGVFVPDVAKMMKPLGEMFINMVKMVIAPLIFFTIVLGIAKMGDMKKVGRVGGKALIYFAYI